MGRIVQFCKNVFEFFATRKYDMDNVTKSYDTEYKKEQKLQNLNNTEQFLSTNLADAYNIWCTRYNTDFKLKTMKTQLTKLEIKEKTVQYKGKSAKCYILSKDILRQNFVIC